MPDPTIPTPQDAQLLLQDTTTKTANYNTPGLDLGQGYAPGGPGRRVSGVVHVTAADRASSDETYAFKLQESDDNVGFVDAGAAEALPVAGATATLGVVLVRGVIRRRYVRLALTVTGTTPSVTFKAWLNPLP